MTARHLNKYIIIYGTVVRTGNVNSRELTKKFKCKLCEREYICESEIADYSSFRLPVRCEAKVEVEKKPNPFFNIAKKFPGKGGKNASNVSGNAPKIVKQDCKSRAFVPVDDVDMEDYADY